MQEIDWGRGYPQKNEDQTDRSYEPIKNAIAMSIEHYSRGKSEYDP